MDNGGSNGHGNFKNRQKFTGQGYSNYTRYEDERGCNVIPQGKRNEYSLPTFPRCGKKVDA